MLGPCRLCAEIRELQDSHFLPAGVYSIVSPDDHPVMVRNDHSLITSFQARGHMLCRTCEHLFNKRGEEWVIENCWHDERIFPLRRALTAASPLYEAPGFRAYDARNVHGVNLDQLTYFAASMFWRGALDGWRMGRETPPTPLKLGPYEKQLREFLLDQTTFPSNAILIIAVSWLQDDLNNRTVAFPFGGARTDEGRGYLFAVPGIWFMLQVGQKIATGREHTTVPGGLLFMTEEGDAHKLAALVSTYKNAAPRGKWARKVRRAGR